ncbi:transposase [Streptomyces sp. NPDC006678]|uniref:transposase n=1 Tax=Streptomyces sp. NPDC006678 TaxID=3157185 RepID=UPI0033D4C85F
MIAMMPSATDIRRAGLDSRGADPRSGSRTGLPRRFRLDRQAVGSGGPLTDAQWARIEPLLPDRRPKRGGRWREHREVIDAIAFKSQTERSGSICRRGMATGAVSTTGCGCGPSTVPGSECSPRRWPRPTLMRTSTGPSRSAPRSCGLTSMRPGRVRRGPGRRAGRPRHRPVPRRSEDHLPGRTPHRGHLPLVCPMIVAPWANSPARYRSRSAQLASP